MRQIDARPLQYPFAGSRMLRDLLRLDGVVVGRKPVATVMRRMRIEALSQRPRTTTPHPGHVVFPSLLRHREITAPNQVWAMDITSLPMRRGFVSLAAVLDWATRRVLAWRLSTSRTVDFCLDAVEAAIRDSGIPEIVHTDQGSQFTGEAFVGLVQQHGIQISMDGTGSWRDNIFVERLWKSVTQEEVYLHAYDSVAEARRGLERYFLFYNQRRPHTAPHLSPGPPRPVRRILHPDSGARYDSARGAGLGRSGWVPPRLRRGRRPDRRAAPKSKFLPPLYARHRVLSTSASSDGQRGLAGALPVFDSPRGFRFRERRRQWHGTSLR